MGMTGRQNPNPRLPKVQKVTIMIIMIIRSTVAKRTPTSIVNIEMLSVPDNDLWAVRHDGIGWVRKLRLRNTYTVA